MPGHMTRADPQAFAALSVLGADSNQEMASRAPQAVECIGLTS